jgi:hypothetical protein
MAGHDLADLPSVPRSDPDVPRARPAFPNFADAPFKDAVAQIESGKLVVKLFVKVRENP